MPMVRPHRSVEDYATSRGRVGLFGEAAPSGQRSVTVNHCRVQHAGSFRILRRLQNADDLVETRIARAKVSADGRVLTEHAPIGVDAWQV